jgi:hypothetical protein
MLMSGWRYAGARWWKLDIHTHTPHSKDTYWASQSVNFTAKEWLLRYMTAEVDCVAVTDHNGGGWVDELKKAYREMEVEPPPGFRALTLFPGVEISVQGGFHLLAIFDPSATGNDVTSLLGACGYAGRYGETEDITAEGALKVINAVVRAGAIAIPAHADDAKGLLQCKPDSMESQVDVGTLKKILDGEQLFACEVVDPIRPKPAVFTQSRTRWTEVVGSDWHGVPGKNEPGSRFTWVKMATPTIEGLRLALLDGERFSVDRSDTATRNRNELPGHFVETLTIKDARVMGRGQSHEVVVRFSPWFNAILGGRGTGKSTIVHALRLAFRREDELPQDTDPARVFQSFKQVAASRESTGGVLNNTEVIAQVNREGLGHRLRWRADRAGSAVEDTDGNPPSGWVSSPVQEVTPQRFPLRIYSQGQIAELARGDRSDALLALVDRSAGADEAKRELGRAIEKYISLRAQLRDLDSQLKARDAVVLTLEDTKRKLDTAERGGHAQTLKLFQAASRQEREVNRQFERAGTLVGRIEGLAKELVAEGPKAGVFNDGVASSAALQSLEKLNEAIHRASKDALQLAVVLAGESTSIRTELDRSIWREKVEAAKVDYEALQEDAGVGTSFDLGSYAKLVRDRQSAEKQLSQFEELGKRRDHLIGEIEAQRQAVLSARQEVSEVRRGFLEAELSSNYYVRIRLVPFGKNHSAIERSFRELITADGDKYSADILEEDADGLPVRGLIFGLLKGLPQGATRVETVQQRLEDWAVRFEDPAIAKGTFSHHFKNHIKRCISQRPDFLDRLRMFFPEDDLEVTYSVKGDGRDFRPLEQASAGQQAAAMLAFLLAHGDEPIVLDQPEDDLDNHLIYDLVVKQIRENKLRRQLIVVTHNPNIVVNGDAEMLYAFDFARGQCRVKQSGSLQDKAVRDEVCKVMEGGREAFERRYRRLEKDA